MKWGAVLEYFTVQGGEALAGTLCLPAAKNSVLPILAASLLAADTVQINGVPRLSDVAVSLEILQCLGCTANFIGGSVRIDTRRLDAHSISPQLAGALRSSVFYLAPLLSRTGSAKIHAPGGCHLGARPIDIHLDGLTCMGASVYMRESEYILNAPNGLHGTDYTLRLPSVGATETLLMAAVAAHGDTILRGVATEPEIEDLAQFLIACGAKISGAGTRIIRVHGSEGRLHGATYSPYPDRITAATVLCAVAAAGGSVSLTGCMPRHMDATLALLSRMGCEVQTGNTSVALYSNAKLHACGEVQTNVYPAFCTDCAPLVAAALLRAQGASTVLDTIFENRFACAEGFAALGANVICTGRSLMIQGVPRLQGAALTAPDLRGGAALLIAALCAEGESHIADTGHLARGYEDIAALFTMLGGKVCASRSNEKSALL